MEATIENIDKLDVSYDKQRDVLYISFGEPREADESKLTENDIVIRYIHGKVVGRLTIISSQKDYHLDTKRARFFLRYQTHSPRVFFHSARFRSLCGAHTFELLQIMPAARTKLYRKNNINQRSQNS